jgi:hypothetical protein
MDAVPPGPAGPTAERAPAGTPAEPATWAGVLHLYVAFDWGEEIDLEHARRLVPGEVHELPRRRRTPASIGYRPPPLRLQAAAGPLELPELGPAPSTADFTVFDFAAVSVAWRVPFKLPAAGLGHVAGWLANPQPLTQAARAAAQPLFERLRPAIHNARWQDDLSEEYVVFQFAPPAGAPAAALLSGPQAAWLAGLLLLETEPLSADEVTEALRLHLSYGPGDLLVPNWAAAVLFDRECEETLQTIEFANLQLLEFRHIDGRLDDSLTAAYRLIHPLVESRLPFWRSHARPLRVLGELKVEANSLFERTGNVLKLMGDQYLARVYRLLAARFHLEAWERSIQRSLEVAEGVYRVVADQAAAYRTEVLEIIVIILIVVEVVLAILRP